MIVSKKMYELGSKRSAIRELFEYGKQQVAKVGAENVFDFSLGNPTVPSPAIVNETLKEIMDNNDSITVHGLLAFSRSIAEVGAVSMVGGAIAWKTNVMTTAIMQYTNQGNFSLGIALGMILLAVSLLVNVVISLLQRRLSQ